MLVSLVAVLALASAASAAPVDACGAPPPNTLCSSYTILSARGTVEPQGGSIDFQTMNKNVFAERTGGKLYNVVYPADWDQNSASGTEDLISQVGKILGQNPSECLLFEGYSQGATLVVDALPRLTGAAFDAVKGVFLIGDPRHEPGLACNVDMQGGDKTKDTTGLFYDKGKSIPQDWVSKSLGDSVCDVTFSNDTLITEEHLAYALDAGMQTMGAAFLLKQLS
ncbi:Cutinase [Cordyceps militaris CM01]|uniref:Cutinase n=1 Tax=Cordyceps militaris (strain CM01) TaxID=983644 RepID=G3J5W5_CORMM|nr:Cutinase [Cordyceps militaris CM01]EGX96917.1 Cutinase [Cordyceps militaris CM01]